MMIFDEMALEYVVGVLRKLGELDDIESGGYPLYTEGRVLVMLDSDEIGHAERVEDFWVFVPKQDSNG